MASKCRSCPVSLVCVAGQLPIKLYCETCRCLELQSDLNMYGGVAQGVMVPCAKEDAKNLHTTLSVCEDCRVARKLGYSNRYCRESRHAVP